MDALLRTVLQIKVSPVLWCRRGRAAGAPSCASKCPAHPLLPRSTVADADLRGLPLLDCCLDIGSHGHDSGDLASLLGVKHFFPSEAPPVPTTVRVPRACYRLHIQAT